MVNKFDVFKILGTITILVIAGLVALNVLYIKVGCLSKNCVVVGTFTILLLIWAIAFWLVVLRYSKKEKKQ